MIQDVVCFGHKIDSTEEKVNSFISLVLIWTITAHVIQESFSHCLVSGIHCVTGVWINNTEITKIGNYPLYVRRATATLRFPFFFFFLPPPSFFFPFFPLGIVVNPFAINNDIGNHQGKAMRPPVNLLLPSLAPLRLDFLRERHSRQTNN